MTAARVKIALLADAGHVNCQRWCEGLKAAGADVHILTFHPVNSGSVVPVTQIPLPRGLGKARYLGGVRSVRRLLEQIRPDILLAYYVTGYGTLAALTGFHPLVLCTSGSDILVAPKNILWRLALRRTLKRADLVTAWQSHMAHAAAQLGVPHERLFILARGIPYLQFASARRPFAPVEKTLSIVSTRSLYDRYRIDVLIKAVKVVRERGVDCSLTIAGEGPHKETLASLIDELKLQGSVRLIGFVSNREIPQLLSQHNVYVSLIDSDGVSASLLEAMVVGLFPIVPDHVANRAWIDHGVNGMLLKDISPEVLATALVDAAEAVTTRVKAWETNLKIVRSRADLFGNTKKYYSVFEAIIRGRYDWQGHAENISSLTKTAQES